MSWLNYSLVYLWRLLLLPVLLSVLASESAFSADYSCKFNGNAAYSAGSPDGACALGTGICETYGCYAGGSFIWNSTLTGGYQTCKYTNTSGTEGSNGKANCGGTCPAGETLDIVSATCGDGCESPSQEYLDADGHKYCIDPNAGGAGGSSGTAPNGSYSWDGSGGYSGANGSPLTSSGGGSGGGDTGGSGGGSGGGDTGGSGGGSGGGDTGGSGGGYPGDPGTGGDGTPDDCSSWSSGDLSGNTDDGSCDSSSGGDTSGGASDDCSTYVYGDMSGSTTDGTCLCSGDLAFINNNPYCISDPSGCGVINDQYLCSNADGCGYFNGQYVCTGDSTSPPPSGCMDTNNDGYDDQSNLPCESESGCHDANGDGKDDYTALACSTDGEGSDIDLSGVVSAVGITNQTLAEINSGVTATNSKLDGVNSNLNEGLGALNNRMEDIKTALNSTAKDNGKGSFESGTAGDSQQIADLKASISTKYTEIKTGISNIFRASHVSGSGSLPCYRNIPAVAGKTFDICFQDYAEELSIIPVFIYGMGFVIAAFIVLGGGNKDA